MSAGGPNSLANEDAHFFERDLSWLAFNERVLALAADETIPLLERVRFCSIFSSNLDEFFQIRVAGRVDQLLEGRKANYGGLSAAELLSRICAETTNLVDRQCHIWQSQIIPELADAGISVLDFNQLDGDQQRSVTEIFDAQIYPVLTPLAVDPGHPFPYISTLSMNLAVHIREPNSPVKHFARVKVPQIFGRLVPVSDSAVFVRIETVISAHLDRLFPGMNIESYFAFRVTRDAELDFEDDESVDLLAAVESELRRRRFGRAVRLEIGADADLHTVELLQRELELSNDLVFRVNAPLDLVGIGSITEIDRPELKYEAWKSVEPAGFRDTFGQPDKLFSRIRRHDVLVQHPYESFTASVERFIDAAANDPSVLAIKQTLYRTSGDSSIVRSLIRAAEAGKQVAALVELKARFDEEANISWARALEQAGVHVVYGLVGLKTHSKTALVVRAEADGLRRYAHFGTGNYHPATARHYEDFSLFTADPDLTSDAADLFNSLTGYARSPNYKKLMLAPVNLRKQLLDLIEQQANLGPSGRVVFKVNAIVDPEIIESLYRASTAGTKVDLVVRGICCLRPGVRGMSENIRVLSVLGRYLEHSRVFAFGNETGFGQKWYIGSADLMPRNLDRRVEVLTPVDDPDLVQVLQNRISQYFAPNVKRWDLGSNGQWTQPTYETVATSATSATSDEANVLAAPDDVQQRMWKMASSKSGRVSSVTYIHAAGGVVWRTSDREDESQTLVIHRNRYDDWAIPKGKRDPGESDSECAIREIFEETGLRCLLGAELPQVSYQLQPLNSYSQRVAHDQLTVESESLMKQNASELNADSDSSTKRNAAELANYENGVGTKLIADDAQVKGRKDGGISTSSPDELVKVVRYWIAYPLDPSQEPHPDGDEVDRVEWLSIDDAIARLTYPAEKALVEAARRHMKRPL